MSLLAEVYVERTVLAAGQPAAGAGVTVPVPESESQLLLACTFRIVTSNVVATRTPVLSVLGGDGIPIAIAVHGFGITASSTADFSFVTGLSESDAAGSSTASGACPQVPLTAGDQLQLSVASIDAGDQLSRVRFVLAQVPVRDDDR